MNMLTRIFSGGPSEEEKRAEKLRSDVGRLRRAAVVRAERGGFAAVVRANGLSRGPIRPSRDEALSDAILFGAQSEKMSQALISGFAGKDIQLLDYDGIALALVGKGFDAWLAEVLQALGAEQQADRQKQQARAAADRRNRRLKQIERIVLRELAEVRLQQIEEEEAKATGKKGSK